MLERVARCLNFVELVRIRGLVGGGDGVVEVCEVFFVESTACNFDVLVDGVAHRSDFDLQLCDSPLIEVLARMIQGRLEHRFDFFIREPVHGLDFDVCGLAGRFLFGAHRQEAVGVNVEANCDARHTRRHRRNARQFELAEGAAVLSEFAFPLNDVEVDPRLVVRVGRETLRGLTGNRGVSSDDLVDRSTHGLQTEGEGSHIHQEDLARSADQNVRLNRRAERDDFIRVEFRVRFASEELLDALTNRRNSSRATDEHDFFDVSCGQSCIRECALAGVDRALDERGDATLELGAFEGASEVESFVRNDEMELRDRMLGELLLAVFRSQACCLLERRIAQRLFVEFVARFFAQPRDEFAVEIISTEVRVSSGCENSEYAFFDRQDGDVEGAATEVVDANGPAVLLVETVRETGGGRLVDDPQDFDSSESSRVTSRLSLSFVEVGRDRDDGARAFTTGLHRTREIVHAHEDQRGELLRRVLLSVNLELNDARLRLTRAIGKAFEFIFQVREPAPHEALDAEDRIERIDDRLTARFFADLRLAAQRKVNHRRDLCVVPIVSNDLGNPVLGDGGERVGRSQIDAERGAVGAIVVENVEFDVTHGPGVLGLCGASSRSNVVGGARGSHRACDRRSESR